MVVNNCPYKKYVTERIEDGQELVYPICQFDKRPCGFKQTKNPCVKTETEGETNEKI